MTEPSAAPLGFVPRLRGIFTQEMGLDLGTANTVIVLAGRGVILREPSVVSVRGKEILAVGEEAKEMLGKTPHSMRAVRPLREGVIADFDSCREMVRAFFRKARGFSFVAPHVVIAIPVGVTEVERRAVREAVLAAGAARADLIDECLAAAIGAGLDCKAPTGRFIVSVGGGTAQATVLSLGDCVVARVGTTAGDALDAALIEHFHSRHGFLIGERTAERLKIEMGSADEPGADDHPLPDEMEVRGRDLGGLPRALRVRAEEVREALSAPIDSLVALVRRTLQATPPELAADVVNDGILLTGGTSLLRGLPRRIERDCGLPVRRPANPLDLVAIGAAEARTALGRIPEVAPMGESPPVEG